MTRFLQWFKNLIDQLQGIDSAQTAQDAATDAIKMAADAIMREAAAHNTGSVLFIPDVVSLSLPDAELSFWNPRIDTLQTEVSQRVARASQRAARRSRRRVEGGTVRVVLTCSGTEPANAKVWYSEFPGIEENTEHRTVGLGHQGSPPVNGVHGCSLQLLVDGSLTASTPAAPGVEIGRHPECQLPVPANHTEVSRHAAIVQAATEDGVRVLVMNRNGAWLSDDDGTSQSLRKGATVTIARGKRLLLDSDARASVVVK